MASSNDGDDAAATVSPQSSATEIIYMEYEGNFLLNCESRVVDVVTKIHTADDDTTMIDIRLDRTVLHAQGGGQPTDTGAIILRGDAESSEEVVVVPIQKVSLDRSTGIVTHHAVTTESPILSIGATVQVKVDEDRRRILSECHTAGHVVDAAMERCGLQDLKPSKGYHFLDSPYVEYKGVIPADEKDTLLAKLQTAFCQLVTEDIATDIALVSRHDADKLCNRTAENFDMDVFADPHTDQVRVVTVAGFPCPCGGTHVRSTQELALNGWGITGFKSKKGVVRVKYGQGCNNDNCKE